MRNSQVEELLYQALETEIGGAQVYEHAIRCAQNDELRQEWTEYLDQTRNHERILRDVLRRFDLDAEKETPGRKVVRHQARSLVQQIVMALRDAPPLAAQLVAAECVVSAETKDHQNWQLLGEVAEALKGDPARALREAYAEVEEEEDEHLYHTQGWARELWLESLGLTATLPPPEERADVKSAAAAARVREQPQTVAARGQR